MIHILFNHCKNNPILHAQILEMASDCRLICHPNDPERALAVKLEDWFKDWLLCREVTCKYQPISSEFSQAIPAVEQMFFAIVTEAIEYIDHVSWMQLAGWWLRELEDNDRETVARN